MSVTNLTIAYYSKTGSLLWSAPFTSFFAGPTGYITDPRGIYDPTSRRFYVALPEQRGDPLACGGSTVVLHLAASKDSVPDNAFDWHKFHPDVTRIVGDCRYAIEYPGGIATDGAHLYLVYEYQGFINCEEECHGIEPVEQIVTVRKATLDTGGTINCQAGTNCRIRYLPEGLGDFTPASVLGAQTPGNLAYFVGGDNDLDSLRLLALSDPLGAATLASTTIGVPSTAGGGRPPQPACANLGGVPLGPQGNAFWYGGYLWTVLEGGPAPNRVHWYKIQTNQYPTNPPALAATGTITAPNGASVTVPAIGGNAGGDACIVFTASSSSQNPAIYFTGKRVGEATFRAPFLLKQSPVCYTGGTPRWGDYATVAADPQDSTFWMAHEWAKTSANNGWGTWWGRADFRVPAAVTDLTATAGRTSIAVNWTEPGPNVCQFDLRYATFPITAENWDSATPAPYPPEPAGPGHPPCYLFSPLSSCTWYWFAIKSRNGVGDFSPLSNVVEQPTLCVGFLEADCDIRVRPEIEGVLASGAESEWLWATAAVGSGAIHIRCQLGAAREPAEVGLYDVAGRLLWRTPVRVAAPGVHEWTVAPEITGRAGVYFVRLRAGAAAWKRTVVVLR